MKPKYITDRKIKNYNGFVINQVCKCQWFFFDTGKCHGMTARNIKQYT